MRTSPGCTKGGGEPWWCDISTKNSNPGFHVKQPKRTGKINELEVGVWFSLWCPFFPSHFRSGTRVSVSHGNAAQDDDNLCHGWAHFACWLTNIYYCQISLDWNNCHLKLDWLWFCFSNLFTAATFWKLWWSKRSKLVSTISTFLIFKVDSHILVACRKK